MVLSLGPAPNVTLYWHGTTVEISGSPIPAPISEPNVMPLCSTAFVVPNVIIIIGLILVTAPNVFRSSLFISLLCAHAVFERSTDRE